MNIGLQIVQTLRSQSRSLYYKKYSKIKRSPKQSTPHCQVQRAHLRLIRKS